MPDVTTSPTSAEVAREYFDRYPGLLHILRLGHATEETLGHAATLVRAALTDPTRKSDWRVDRRGANAGSCRACVTGAPHEPWTDEEAGFVEEALRCSDADSSGHWPTAAGWLACEVRRLRAALAAAPAEPDERESRKYAIGFDWSLYEQSDVPAVAWEDGYRAGAARPVSPDDAHTETVTEYRVVGRSGPGMSVEVVEGYSEADIEMARDQARYCVEDGWVEVAVESRTVTTSRRESEWKATDQ